MKKQIKNNICVPSIYLFRLSCGNVSLDLYPQLKTYIYIEQMNNIMFWT